MAQFYLVRHGQASFGTDNYDRLSHQGHQQARWLGEYWAERDLQFDALISGDLIRHRETGAGILEGLGQHLQDTIHPGLNEFDFQALVAAYLRQNPDQTPPEGAPAVAFYRVLKVAMQQWQRQQLVDDLPETWQQFAHRVAAARDHLQANHAHNDRVLIVSSGGAIAMFLQQLLRAEEDTVVELNLQMRNSGVTEGFFNRHTMRLASFNNVPHLDRPDRFHAITYT